jgi:hypothetical protein
MPRYTLIKYLSLAGLLFCSLPSVAAPCPADWSQLAAGQWCEVPGSSLSSAASGRKVNIIKPWSGAVFDSLRSRLVVWGGGHTDYSGNEIFAFDIGARRWQQLTSPSSVPADFNGDRYPDGAPSSRHTYNGLVYLAELDQMWSVGGSRWRNGDCGGGPWRYDFKARPAAQSGWSKIDSPHYGGCQDAAVYDPRSGHIWVWTRRGLFEVESNSKRETWHERHPQRESRYYTGALDPERGRLMFLGSGESIIFDVSKPKKTRLLKTAISGEKEIEKATAPGLAFDSKRRRFTAWSGQPETGLSPQSVYVFDADEMTWRRHTASDRTLPTVAARNRDYTTGTYGRFQYMPNRDVFILVNSIDENVFFYKPLP